jgi:23S rRNA U2552 (ribose-2'-O)-methylase RlmE/FtsJ
LLVVIIRKGKCVLDLGCSPGGWAQVAAKRVVAAKASGAGAGRSGLVVGVDIKRTHAPATGWGLQQQSTLLIIIHVLMHVGAAVDVAVDGATFLQLDMSSADALPAILSTMKEVIRRTHTHTPSRTDTQLSLAPPPLQRGYDKADAVVSDMAPSASGIKSVDHVRLMARTTHHHQRLLLASLWYVSTAPHPLSMAA